MPQKIKLVEAAVAKIIEKMLKEETNTFYAFFNNKKIEIEATSLWDAKKQAIQQLKVPKSKEGLLSVISKKSYDGEEFRFN